MRNVAVLGLGPIGVGIARELRQRSGVRVVAAIDLNPRLAGRPLGDVVNDGAGEGPMIATTAEEALDGHSAGVIVHATASKLEQVVPQVAELAASGWSILSTCEELSYADAVDRRLARWLDETARGHGVSVVGAGVNPGFVMDLLPIILTGTCLSVDQVSITRTVDTNTRRPQLQAKVGVTLTAEDFTLQAAAGRLGHVGLKQSASLIAKRLGWRDLEYTQSLVPVIAEYEVETPIGTVAPGGVLGQRQLAVLRQGTRDRVSLALDMYAGAAAEDRVEIHGEPSVTQVIVGGLNGDIATIALISNLIPVVAGAAPGLWTVADLLPLACIGDTGNLAARTPARITQRPSQ